MNSRTGTRSRGRRGRKDRPDRVPYLGSALIHFGAIAVLFITSIVQPTPLQFEVHEMDEALVLASIEDLHSRHLARGAPGAEPGG